MRYTEGAMAPPAPPAPRVPQPLPAHLRVEPGASRLRVALSAPVRSLDLLSAREDFESAASEPLRPDEMANPDIAAQMLGQAIVLWDQNPLELAVREVISRLLAAGARADRPVQLPRHWRLDKEIELPQGDSLPTGPARHHQTCMPLEWFLASRDPVDEDAFFLDPMPEATTRALFAGVDVTQPSVDQALEKFFGRARSGRLCAAAAWLSRHRAQTRLEARLPAATVRSSSPRL